MRFFIILGLIRGLVLSAEAKGRLRLAPVAETLITMDIMDSRISSVFKFPCNTVTLVHVHSLYYTVHVFPETGQPKEPMDRQFLVQELNITERDSTSHSM